MCTWPLGSYSAYFLLFRHCFKLVTNVYLSISFDFQGWIKHKMPIGYPLKLFIYIVSLSIRVLHSTERFIKFKANSLKSEYTFQNFWFTFLDNCLSEQVFHVSSCFFCLVSKHPIALWNNFSIFLYLNFGIYKYLRTIHSHRVKFLWAQTVAEIIRDCIVILFMYLVTLTPMTH